MKASLFYPPSTGTLAEIQSGMAATRPEFHRGVLAQLSEQIRRGRLRVRPEVAPIGWTGTGAT
jgi:hypothetical protein